MQFGLFVYLMARKFHYDFKQIRDMPFAFALTLTNGLSYESEENETQIKRIKRR